MLNLLRKERSGNKRRASFLLTKEVPVRCWLSSSEPFPPMLQAALAVELAEFAVWAFPGQLKVYIPCIPSYCYGTEEKTSNGERPVNKIDKS